MVKNPWVPSPVRHSPPTTFSLTEAKAFEAQEAFEVLVVRGIGILWVPYGLAR